MLILLLLLPFCGAACLALLPGASQAASRRTAMSFLAMQFATLLWLTITAFDFSKGGMQLTENLNWVPELGFQFGLAVDGLSLVMMFLSTAVFAVALFASRPEESGGKGFFSLLLVALGGLSGVFLTTDLFLWFICWELVLIPLYFLIGLVGAGQRFKAADRFLLLSQGSAALILLCIAALYLRSSADGLAPTTHIFELQSQAVSWLGGDPSWLGMGFTSWVFALLGLSFAAMMGLFPFHGWLNSLSAQCSLPVGILLVGVITKVGAYALIRFVFPIAPHLLPEIAGGLQLVAFVGVAYCGRAMLSKTNIHSKVAYGASSLMGLFLFGICVAATPFDHESRLHRLQSLTGATFHLLIHSIVFVGLLIMARAYSRRDQDLDLPRLSGRNSTSKPPFILTRGVWLFWLLPLGVSTIAISVGAFHSSPWLTGTAVFIALFFLLRLGKSLSRLGRESQNWQAHQLPALDRWERRPLLTLAWVSLLLLIPFLATDHIQVTLNVILGSFSGGVS